MQLIDKRKFLVYSGISATACIFSIIFIKADFFIYRIINGLFIGGLFSLIPGLISYLRSIGMLDIFIYSYRTLRSYSKHFEDELKEGKKAKTYHEFKLEKAPRPFSLEPLFIGGILVFISAISSFIAG